MGRAAPEAVEKRFEAAVPETWTGEHTAEMAVLLPVRRRIGSGVRRESSSAIGCYLKNNKKLRQAECEGTTVAWAQSKARALRLALRGGGAS